ncbi:hypothetical protein EV586_106101 [Tumebacillus sp. BK434]|uniref:HAD-IIB family hydrolase n=1 Tax=Tumebacillus sp. BK434 TaxID=2512169 RepID=UPI001052D76E|nr:HAD-IIB family hydrolase [Tumebacillus sp. BK434]TCP53367.1 hypothetical protein EV586_106101 [Tumebacillus sp. BK434]
MMIRLIAIDLDDTLIARSGQVPEANWTALRRAQDAGVRVVIATARGFAGAKRFYDPLGLDTPMIVSSGSNVVDGRTGTVLRRRLLPLEFARAVAEFADEHDIALRVYVGSEVWNNFDYDPVNGTDRTVERTVARLHEQLVEAPYQIFVKGNREAQLILREFGEAGDGYCCRHHVYGDGISELNILHPQATKQDALAELCAALEVPREQVMALGDSRNDLGMIRWAGLGVAMSWAPSDVQEAADWVLPADAERLTGDQDAEVAEAILRFVLQAEEQQKSS